MKILSDKEYERLRDMESEDFRKIRRDFRLEVEDMQRKAKQDKDDYTADLKRLHAETDLIVQEKTKVLTQKNQELTIENNNNKKEVEILTKAFENLGFDVKDMKSILDKLVDGLVSKNTIQMINANPSSSK